ncbi:unnamed protein product, partial [Acanthoscelides obtectus]
NEPLEERQQHDEEPISDYDDSDADPNYEPSVSPRRKKIKFSDFDDVSLAPLKNRQPLKKVNENVNANCRVSQERPDKQEKHPLLLSCHNNCRQKCSSKINDENFRELIRTKFWRLSFGERRLFLDAHIKQFEIKVRRQEAQRSSRNVSLKYFLPLPVETEAKFEKIQVCKTMFLHTLGLKTDGMITCHIHSKKRSVEGIAQTVDERGLVIRGMLEEQKMRTEEIVIKHINSFNPVVSHYNLKHTPNRRFLPPDLTIKYMWQDFCNLQKISYDLYRRIFEKQNIGFKKPSQDECAQCLKHKVHIIRQCDASSCKICCQFENHKKSYMEARQHYENDSNQEVMQDEKIYAVDMQKVLLLPKMSTKESFFVSRLVVFNETFVSLHKDGNICVMWHEAIRGRSATDVASAYYNVIKNSDNVTKKFTFWVDNCSAQNKNWTLYSAFATFVNCEWGPEEITLKYFEPGHSFMAADSVHGRISTEMKKHPNIYDFEQLLKIIEQSSKKTKCLPINNFDFFLFEDGSKQIKSNNIPLLEKIKLAQFRKGCRHLFYKECHNETVFQEVEFLKKKVDLKFPIHPFVEPLGLNSEKRETILKKLVPSFKDERKKLFWQFLPSNDNSKDLCVVSEA